MTPDQERHLPLKRIDRIGRGILLLHDAKLRTARMLPALLRTLEERATASCAWHQ
jgi:hypothetical protein